MTENADKLGPEAVDALKELFWRQGYDKTSIEDVVRVTGRNRYTLYNSFGGKRELFLAALDAYQNERKAVFIENLSNPAGQPLDAIRKVFEFAISEMADRGSGCLMCNVANDIAPHDALVASRIAGYLDEMRNAFKKALSAAQDREELNPNISPEEGAALLIPLIFGLGVQAKQGATAEMMIATSHTAMRAIEKASVQ